MDKIFFVSRIIAALGLFAVWGMSGLSVEVMLIPFTAITAWVMWLDFKWGRRVGSTETGYARMALDFVIFGLAYLSLVDPMLAGICTVIAILAVMALYVWWHWIELGWLVFSHRWSRKPDPANRIREM